MPDAPAVSVIVATYRRYGDLVDCLRSLAQARTSGGVDFETIVVDDGGGLPRAIEGEVPELPVDWIYAPENRGQAAAQALGVARGRGAILAFLDDDAVVAPGWVREIRDYFDRHPDISAVLGRIRARDLTHVLARMRQQIYERRHATYTDPAYRDRLKARYALPVTTDAWLSETISGGNSAFRRDALERAGGPASELRRGADRQLAERLLTAGCAIGYNPEMVIYHVQHRGWRFLIANSFRVGRAQVQGLRGGGKGRLTVLGYALASPIRAPFRIRQARYLFAADPSRLKVYVHYTAIQWLEAIGQIYQAFGILVGR